MTEVGVDPMMEVGALGIIQVLMVRHMIRHMILPIIRPVFTIRHTDIPRPMELLMTIIILLLITLPKQDVDLWEVVNAYVDLDLLTARLHNATTVVVMGQVSPVLVVTRLRM